MRARKNNYAYIDGANLYNAMLELGWALDYKRFRVWLSHKYGIARAYLFIGLIPRHSRLYTYLQECGFTLVFKEVVYDDEGKPKGNCDADLVLRAVCDAYENRCEQTLLVSSDGDYAGLVKFLRNKKKLRGILSPSMPAKCSVLLKRTAAPIAYLNDQRSILESSKKKKPPAGMKPRKGPFRGNQK